MQQTKQRRHIAGYAIELMAAIAVGPLAVAGSALIEPGVQHGGGSLCPLIGTGIENSGFLVLLGVCIFLGLWTGRANPWLLGLLTMSAFPVIAVAEMIVDSTSHNLFPIEFTIYAFAAVLNGGCVSIGRLMTKKVTKAV